MSHLVGLYRGLYFAKTGLVVSDKMVHVHPKGSPLWIQSRGNIHYISPVKSCLNAAGLGEWSNFNLRSDVFSWPGGCWTKLKPSFSPVVG